MNVRYFSMLAGFVFTVSSTALFAETEEQIAAIEDMGKWYGIALPCKYLDQTRRIKQEMVAALPKKRYLGQVFEQATNRSFLDFANAREACPGEASLAKEVDIAVDTLNRVFPE